MLISSSAYYDVRSRRVDARARRVGWLNAADSGAGLQLSERNRGRQKRFQRTSLAFSYSPTMAFPHFHDERMKLVEVIDQLCRGCWQESILNLAAQFLVLGMGMYHPMPHKNSFCVRVNDKHR